MSDDLEPKTYPGHYPELESALKGIADSLAHIEFKLMKLAIMSVYHDEMLLNKSGVKPVNIDDLMSLPK